MEEEKSLYEDSQLLIDYLPGCIEDYFILIKPDGNYALPRGVLREFARTNRDRLEDKLMNLSRYLINEAQTKGLSVSDLGMAMAQAYIDEQERIQRVMLETEAENL